MVEPSYTLGIIICYFDSRFVLVSTWIENESSPVILKTSHPVWRIPRVTQVRRISPRTNCTTSEVCFVSFLHYKPTIMNLSNLSLLLAANPFGKIAFEGFQHCPKFCENEDKSLCYGCFTFPENIQVSENSLQ